MLTLIHGVMKSGKTLEFIKKYNSVKHSKIAIKHEIDVRDGKSTIKSRNGEKIYANLIFNSINNLIYLEYLLKTTDIENIFISEFQFFDFDMYLFITNNKNKYNFYIEGLLKDYQQKYFGYTYRLLDFADSIIECNIFCEKCKEKKAEVSHRLTEDTSTVLIGDSQYEARCLDCI